MCEKKNNLRWSGRPWTGFMYPSRAILTSSLRCWKIFVCLIFVVVGHWQNIFNDANFPVYGSRKLSREKLSQMLRFMTICESILCEIWERGVFWWHQQAICESFLHENLIFYQLWKFSLVKVFFYTVLLQMFSLWYNDWLTLQLGCRILEHLDCITM